MYKLTRDLNTVQRLADKAFVDISHPTYQEWLSNGNLPGPADTETEKVIEITKLEFKKRLVVLNKYTEAKTILDGLSEDKKEDWELASCVASNNADILAVLTALNINASEILY